MKVLVLEVDQKKYRISIYPGSLGGIISCNGSLFKFPGDWFISGFSPHLGCNANVQKIKFGKVVYFGEEFNKDVHVKKLKGYWVWDYMSRLGYFRRWSDRIKEAYLDEASPEEVALIIKARILK